MAKKQCPNGHIYDSSIYGDECPLCPRGSAGSSQSAGSGEVGGTRINPPEDSFGGGQTFANPVENPQPQPHRHPNPMNGLDAAGETHLGSQQASGRTGGGQGARNSASTMIRTPKGDRKTSGRKLVGFLVTYNRYPLGKSYELYEGKNFIGRDNSSDIVIPDDNQISGRHLMILYRNVDNKFKYHDEQSSNGTFINKELSDEGELQNYDIIRLGNTVFIFIAIPQF